MHIFTCVSNLKLYQMKSLIYLPQLHEQRVQEYSPPNNGQCVDRISPKTRLVGSGDAPTTKGKLNVERGKLDAI